MSDRIITWRGKRVGSYGLSQKGSEYTQGEVDNLLNSERVQAQINQYLGYPENKRALAALYEVSQDQLEHFLATPDPLQAREAFQIAFEQKIKTIPHAALTQAGQMPSTTVKAFLGKDLYKLYKAAVNEELQSKNYKNAVFLKSVSFYEGETLATPVYIAAGGASGGGKSFLKKPSVEEVVKYFPKKRDHHDEVVKEGNIVVSIDNGIARDTLQMGKMFLQYAFSKGYKEVEDYNEITKASAKKQIKAAAEIVGLNMYKPKTYPKFQAYKTVLEMVDKHDGYHTDQVRYDVIATNITANQSVVRHQGMTRAQLQAPFLEGEIDLNLAKMPAESKRYGRLIGDIDQKVEFLKNVSFHTGQNNSQEAAEEFRKKGIPVIEIDSTNRILVRFKPMDENHQLVEVDNAIAGSSEAFITSQEAFSKWNSQNRVEGGSLIFSQFEKSFMATTQLKARIVMDEARQEMHWLQEAYVEFYKKVHKQFPNKKLVSIENFNEFLRFTKIHLDSGACKKLLSTLTSTSISLGIKADIFIDPFDFYSTENSSLSLTEYLQQIIAARLVKFNDHFHRLESTFSNEAKEAHQASLLIEQADKPLQAFNYTQGLKELQEGEGINVLDWLKEIGTRLLDAKSRLIEIEDKKVRVFNGLDSAFQLKIDDFYEKGLSHAYAMVKIKELETLNVCPKKLQACLVIYTQKMQALSFPDCMPAHFELAKKHTLDFIGSLSYLLSEARATLEYDKAFEDIKKANELYTMIEPTEDSICTVTQQGDGMHSYYEVQLSERLTFDDLNESFSVIQSSIWYKQLLGQYGAWFNRFMHIHFKEALMRSPLSMTQNMPNLANAWRESSFVVDKEGKNRHSKQSHIRAATIGTDIKNKEESIRIATDSMKKLFNQKELGRLAHAYIEQWGWLFLKQESIVIEGLHQTLLNPLAIRKSDRKMVQVKEVSNEWVKTHLSTFPLIIGQHRITFRLNQVNNPVRACTSNLTTHNETVDSDVLVKNANQLFEALLAFSEDPLVQRYWVRINKICSFLNEMPSRALTKIEQTDFKDTVEMLNSSEVTALLSLERKRELSLRLQAAVYLKCLNYKMENSRVSRFKPLVCNKQIIKSVYELILADMAISGCKRALDDTGEVNNHKQAMMRQFNKTGHLLDALSGNKIYQEYNILYYMPVVKIGHQNRVIAATDKVGAAKKRGLAIASPNGKKAKIAIQLRKLKNPLKKAKKAEINKTLSKFYPDIHKPEEAVVSIVQQPAPIILSTTVAPCVKRKRGDIAYPPMPLRAPPLRPR